MSNPWHVIALILATTSSAVWGAPTVSATSNDTRLAAQTRPVEKDILTLDNDTISCSLPEGDTTFIISLVRSSPLDRFTFINENTTARGELRIAVSNEKLGADSDKWTPVDGATSFKRKRLFSVSLLGIQAKYIRLTFHVEHENDIAALGGKASAQLVVDQKVTIARFSSWVANNGRREGSSVAARGRFRVDRNRILI